MLIRELILKNKSIYLIKQRKYLIPFKKSAFMQFIVIKNESSSISH